MPSNLNPTTPPTASNPLLNAATQNVPSNSPKPTTVPQRLFHHINPLPAPKITDAIDSALPKNSFLRFFARIASALVGFQVAVMGTVLASLSLIIVETALFLSSHIRKGMFGVEKIEDNPALLAASNFFMKAVKNMFPVCCFAYVELAKGVADRLEKGSDHYGKEVSSSPNDKNYSNPDLRRPEQVINSSSYVKNDNINEVANSLNQATVVGATSGTPSAPLVPPSTGGGGVSPPSSNPHSPSSSKKKKHNFFTRP